MPKKKNNHFVGRGVVKFWANSKKQVTYWEKDDKGALQPRNPDSVHSADYLYAKWDISGNRDMCAEDALAVEIDNDAPKQIEYLLGIFPDIVPLTSTQKQFFAKFILRTVLRNPNVLTRLSLAPAARLVMWLRRVQRRLTRGRNTDLAYKRIGKDRTLLGDFVSSIVTIDIDKRVQQLTEKRFAILIPSEGVTNFVLGSQPYFINPRMLSGPNSLGRKDDAFCGMVIHPRMMLAIFDDNDPDEIIAANQEDMNRINGLFIKYSTEVVVKSPQDLDGVWYRPHGQEEGDIISVVHLEKKN